MVQDYAIEARVYGPGPLGSVLKFHLKTVSPVEVGLSPGMGQGPVGQPLLPELNDRRHANRQGLVRRHNLPQIQFQGNLQRVRSAPDAEGK